MTFTVFWLAQLRSSGSNSPGGAGADQSLFWPFVLKKPPLAVYPTRQTENERSIVHCGIISSQLDFGTIPHARGTQITCFRWWATMVTATSLAWDRNHERARNV